MPVLRSENTIQLLTVMTGETAVNRCDPEYVKFWFDKPVTNVRVVAVDVLFRSNATIDDPWALCECVVKAYEPALAYGPNACPIFALRYGSNVHKHKIAVYATGDTI